MRPLRSYESFIVLMQNVSNPLVGILVATIFTSLIQSSSATMGVVIALALQGLITLEAGIALALGANIGTCATAGLAAIGKPREAVRVAVAHVTFKIIGVALVLPFIPYFTVLVRDISPVAVETWWGWTDWQRRLHARLLMLIHFSISVLHWYSCHSPTSSPGSVNGSCRTSHSLRRRYWCVPVILMRHWLIRPAGA